MPGRWISCSKSLRSALYAISPRDSCCVIKFHVHPNVRRLDTTIEEFDLHRFEAHEEFDKEKEIILSGILHFTVLGDQSRERTTYKNRDFESATIDLVVYECVLTTVKATVLC